MSFKVPVCRRSEYTIYLQDIDGTTWAHCDVQKWTASIHKRFSADADQVFAMHGGPMLALNEPAGCFKHQKFLKLMGFHFHQKIITNTGDERLIYKRG